MIAVVTAAGKLSSEMQAVYDNFNGIEKWIADSYIDITSGISYVKDMLKMTGNDVGYTQQIWDFFYPAGVALIVLYFLITVMQDMQNRYLDVDWRYIGTMFLRLAIAQSFLLFGPSIIVGLYKMGNYLIDNMPLQYAAGGYDSTEFGDAIVRSIEDLNFFDLIPLLISSLVLKGANLIPNLMISLHAVSRKIEIILRGGLLVLALPAIVMEGTRSAGVRSIKRLTVAVVHGFVMMAVVSLAGFLGGTQLIDSILQGGNMNLGDLDVFLQATLYNFAAIGLMSASKAFLNDVFD